jgi:hypothetical protein
MRLQNSGANKNAPRERSLTSSLPDLIRQSMLRSRSLSRLRRFGMDHRVKPGGDAVLGCAAKTIAERTCPVAGNRYDPM